MTAAPVRSPGHTAGVRTAPLDRTGPFPPLFALVGAHGGSGAGTLAHLWAPAADTGGCWPGSAATTQRVLIVAREHMAGVAAAADLLRAAADGHTPPGVQVCGFITVACQPGRPDKDVRRYAATIGELAPHTYRIPWLKPLVALLPRQLPSWKPSDGVRVGRETSRGDLASVPTAIAQVGAQVCGDLAADHAAGPQPDPPVTPQYATPQ